MGKVKHIFKFDTDEDWVPGDGGCWMECPFSFNIKLGDRCRAVSTSDELGSLGSPQCPFIRSSSTTDDIKSGKRFESFVKMK